jgi:hypothetical protein
MPTKVEVARDLAVELATATEQLNKNIADFEESLGHMDLEVEAEVNMEDVKMLGWKFVKTGVFAAPDKWVWRLVVWNVGDEPGKVRTLSSMPRAIRILAAHYLETLFDSICGSLKEDADTIQDAIHETQKVTLILRK